MSEKNTDHYLQTQFEEIFGEEYSTSFKESPYNIFGKKRPDGCYIHNENIIIIENKASHKNKDNALQQAMSYVTPKVKQYDNIYLLVGLGNNKTPFKCYIFDDTGDELDVTLEGLKGYINPNNRPIFSKNKIHDFNQYLYDNSINLPKSQKTLFIASMLICLKLDKTFVQNIERYNVTTRMMELIQNAFNDNIFTEQFRFISQSLFKTHLPILFQKLADIVKSQDSDILNQFYSEFCLWDRNNDSKFGVVLTPDDVVDMMCKELDITNKDSVLDFCTGTGSFLIKASQYSKHLYGAENNAERYALAKCNFILHDLDHTNLHYDSCFNVDFPKVDKCIINPPFSVKCSDGKVSGSYKNWNREQKFIMYMIDCLKDNGVGCCIVPCGNVTNITSKHFKQEFLKVATPIKTILCNSKLFQPNAGVKCVIIVFKKKPYENEEVELVSYEDDGYKIKNNVRTKINESDIKSQKQILTLDNTWCFMNKNVKFNHTDLISSYIKQKLNDAYDELLTKLKNGNIIKHVAVEFEVPDLNVSNSEYKINEWFELVKHKSKSINDPNLKEGVYPLVSSSMKNNGIVKHINTYDLDGRFLVVSFAREPNSGFTSFHTGKFSVTSCVGVLKPIKEMSDELLIMVAMNMSQQLSARYDRGNTLNNVSLMNETIISKQETEKINTYKLSDLFEIIKPKPNYKKYKVEEVQEYIDDKHNIPYISAIKHNNGVKGYVEKSAFDEGEYYGIAKTGDGAGGYVYHIKAPFNFNPTVMILKSKVNIKNSLALTTHLTNILHNIYDHGRSFTQSSLNEEVDIPEWMI
jgi:type I restriction-modification system DNA methylase subunit